MIRKFNFTNRKTIPRENISISIVEVDGRSHFNANISTIGLEFPQDAKVFIEPFYGPDSLRFEFGSFSAIEQPVNTDITELRQLSNRIYFHVKLVDQNNENGLLLGDAKIYDLTDDASPTGRSSILHVNPVKMDSNEVWRLDFGGEMPVLEVNNTIVGIFDIAKTDIVFISLVYPAAIRRILEYIVYQLEDFDDEGESWNAQWLRFSRSTLGVTNTPTEKADEECEEWINTVIKAFCIKHKLLENYLQKINK